MASLTIVFGAVWSLSDQTANFKKDETDSDRGGGRAEAARGSGLEGLEITDRSAAYFVVSASGGSPIIFFTMQHWVFIIIKGVFCFAAVQGLTALFFAAIDSSFKSMSQDVDLPMFGTVNAVSVPAWASRWRPSWSGSSTKVRTGHGCCRISWGCHSS